MSAFKTIGQALRGLFSTPIKRRTVAAASGSLITAASVSMAVFLSIADLKTAPMTAQFEGMVLQNYMDVVGVETWCVGETQVGRLEKGYTREYCLALFKARFSEYSSKLYGCYTEDMKRFVTPAMHGAFTDVYFNTGARCNTGMMRALMAGRPVAACDFILKYKRAGGKDCSIRTNGCYGVWDRRIKMHGPCLEEAQQLEASYASD